MEFTFLTFALIFCGMMGLGTSTKFYYQQASPYRWRATNATSMTFRTSKIGCAHECSQREKCFSFDWDDMTHFCTIDTWVCEISRFSHYNNKWRPKIYRTCPTNLGYVTRSIPGWNDENFDQCLWFDRTTLKGFAAEDQCLSINGRLYKANTALKTRLLKNTMNGEGFGGISWLGLRITEWGRHTVWSDGQPLTPEEGAFIYEPGRPVINQEVRCHYYYRNTLRATDLHCDSATYQFICETNSRT